MGVFIATIAFIFVMSVACARGYRRRCVFSSRQGANVMVASDPTTGAIIVANSNSVDDADDQFSKNPSPFCKYCIVFLRTMT